MRGRFPALAFEPPELVIDPRGGEPGHAYRLRGSDERPGTGDARELLVDAATAPAGPSAAWPTTVECPP